jgi:transposase
MPLEIKIPLDIPDVRLVSTQITDQGEFIITLESTLDWAECHRCGARITEFHGHDAPIRLRHLSIFDRVVYIEIRPRRYRCVWCRKGPTTTQRCSWYEPGRPHTKAYDQWLLLCLIGSTVSAVAQQQRLGYGAVLGALRHQISTVVCWEAIEELGTIGLDEIALKRGSKNFVTIVSSRVGSALRVLGVLESHKKKVVKRFLKQIPERLVQTVTSVCTDMWQGFTSSARSVLSSARLVVDRFHVAKLYGKCADEVRKRERARLERELTKADYEAEVAGVTWLYRARAESLKPEQAAALERFFVRAPAARAAWELRCELTELFEREMSKEQAREALLEWAARAEGAGYKRFCTTLRRWIEEITNYFVERETSGFVEGLNNKLKVITRRCYGLRNIDDFYRRIVLDVELQHVLASI